MIAEAHRGQAPSKSRWRVAGTSVQGTSHIKSGQPCQDSSYHYISPDGDILIAAVADGAGSARLSDVGSALTARESVEAARISLSHSSAEISEGYLRSIARTGAIIARSKLEQEASSRGIWIGDLATTLLLVICSGGVIAVAQVGDGGIVISDEAKGFSTLTAPQRGEYANETIFLVSRGALSSLQISAARVSVPRIAMFTDGIQNLVLASSDYTPHAPFFSPLFRWFESRDDQFDFTSELKNLLTSPKFTQRADDDLTLLLASTSKEV